MKKIILSLMVFSFLWQLSAQTVISYHEHFYDKRMKWSEFNNKEIGFAELVPEGRLYYVESSNEKMIKGEYDLKLDTKHDFIYSYSYLSETDALIGLSSSSAKISFELSIDKAKFRINYTKNGELKYGSWKKLGKQIFNVEYEMPSLKIIHKNNTFYFYYLGVLMSELKDDHFEKPKSFDKLIIGSSSIVEVADVFIQGYVYLDKGQQFLNGVGIPEEELAKKKFYSLNEISSNDEEENLKVYKLKIDQSWDKNSLPEEVFNCCNLQQVEIDGTEGKDYTKIFGQLANFQYLSRLDLNIGKLPLTIGKLKNIQTLNMENIAIDSDVLPEIFKLSKLDSLDLSNNGSDDEFKLEQLKNIGNLQQLKYLKLEHNDLGAMPEGIFKLSKLEYLNLSGNKLKELPKEIGKLAKLKELDLSYNFEISSLPPEIGNLKALEFFNISGNIDNMWFSTLTEIPKEMGKLSNLKGLNFGLCEVKHVPEELANLKNLEYFTIQGRFSKEEVEKLNKLFSYVTELVIIENEYIKF